MINLTLARSIKLLQETATCPRFRTIEKFALAYGLDAERRCESCVCVYCILCRLECSSTCSTFLWLAPGNRPVPSRVRRAHMRVEFGPLSSLVTDTFADKCCSPRVLRLVRYVCILVACHTLSYSVLKNPTAG